MTDDRVVLRFATAEDAEQVAALHADSWRRHYRGAYADAFLDGTVAEDREAAWTARLAREQADAFTLVAEVDGRVAGFAHTFLDSDPAWGALLENLHVTFDLKRHGIGSQLIRRVAELVAERRPGQGLHLWVLEQNTPAQAFYLAMGGAIVEQGAAPPPGGDPSRLAGEPRRLRVAWQEPGLLIGSR